MKNIKIGEEVYTFLQKKAIVFEEEPNDVLRRILGLNQVSDPQKPSHTLAEKTRKQPRTNLQEIVRAGLISDGQRLIFQHSGKRLPEYTATISEKSMHWRGKRYSMSALAGMALETIGLDGKSVRGPLFWFTENGKSIQELWEQYLSRADRNISK